MVLLIDYNLLIILTFDRLNIQYNELILLRIKLIKIPITSKM